MPKFHVIDGPNKRIRFWEKEDPNASDLIAFCEFHPFLVEVQTNAGYTYMQRMPCMYNNNLEIKIAGSSCRPQ